MADTLAGNPTSDPHRGPIDLSRPHFVGIGGQAMSEIAELCLARLSRVSGTDAAYSPRLEALRRTGAKIDVGHDAAAVDGATCVVYTTVAADAPEVAAARDAGIPVVHRAQVLDQLVGDNKLVAVAGTHGKTTTTAMLSRALVLLDEDPTYLVGGDFDRPGSGLRIGTGDLIVAEADESDRGFHFLHPTVAVITNIHHDHPENYTGLADHIAAYEQFVAGMAPNGTLVANADDKATQAVVEQLGITQPNARVVSFGYDAAATVRITEVTQQRGSLLVKLDVAVGGPVVVTIHTLAGHHVVAAAAAVAAVIALGYEAVDAAEAVSGFRGVRRRFETVGMTSAVTVVDCYADHPNELAADLLAARQLAGDGGRILAVVQPAGYARVRDFSRDYGQQLAAGADHTYLLKIHGGQPIAGVTSALIGQEVRAAGGMLTLAEHDEVAQLVAGRARPGDVVLLLGTGNVTDLAAPLLVNLEQHGISA